MTQVVTNGTVSPGSGTFTETFVNGGVQEHLFQYNAELALPFQEQANTVYWLKIVALVDPATEGGIKWGWHDRDWSQTSTLFSPAVVPGERVVGTVPNAAGQPVNVWHFQDDAVSGIQAAVNSAGVWNTANRLRSPELHISGSRARSASMVPRAFRASQRTWRSSSTPGQLPSPARWYCLAWA